MNFHQLVAITVPKDFLPVLRTRQDAGDDEQQVRQPVQVFDNFGSDVLVLRQRECAPFRTAHCRPRYVTCRGGGAAPGEYELFQARQVSVQYIEVMLQSIDECLRYCAVSGNTQFTTKLKEIMLDLGQAFSDIGRYRITSEYNANGAVCLIDRSVGFYALAVFSRSAAVAQAGCAVISGARINLAESISHGATIGSGGNTVKKSACFAAPIRP